jgi:PKD repeat protein
MLKHLLFLRLAVLGGGLMVALATFGQAQAPAGTERATPGLVCGFDHEQQVAFRQQPGAQARYEQFLQDVARVSSTEQARGQSLPDVTVPVVVHIIHTGGASNISDAQVHDALRILNEDFSKRNADTASIIPAFQSRIANVGFQFRLAQRDPNGNCTTGITRTYSPLTNIGDNQVKSLIVWNQSRYLNIWICANANGAAGYATSPCFGGPNDGIVIRNDRFGTIGTGLNSTRTRAVTHETGHYFGLQHTWGPTDNPGLPSNCTTDDGIADTPNTIGINNCNLSFSPCTDASGQPILANVQNYMEYSGCLSMFTTGQRAVMRASLQLGCRAQLTTAANLLATGTNDGFAGGPCAPVVAFEPSVSSTCEGGTVTFADYSYNDQTGSTRAYSWSFPGGTPATSTLPNPTVTYPTPGHYGATLTVTSTPGGSTTRTRTQLVQVTGANAGLAGPLAESFENPGFPNNFAAPDLRNWTATASAAAALPAAWQRANPPGGGLVASDGGACLWVRSNLLPANTVTWLTSPNINLSAYSASSPPVLSFDRAYALRTTPVNENLQVQVSTDCGVTWTTAASYPSSALNTMGALRSNTFVPTAAADWQPLQIPINPGYVGPYFQVRFQLTSQQGNALYLDHVRIALPTAARSADLAARYGLRLFPNPATAETSLELTLPAPAAVEVRLTDVLGRPVLSPIGTRLPAGRQAVALPGAAQLARGLYLVQVHTGGHSLTSKLLVQ